MLQPMNPVLRWRACGWWAFKVPCHEKDEDRYCVEYVGDEVIVGRNEDQTPETRYDQYVGDKEYRLGEVGRGIRGSGYIINKLWTGRDCVDDEGCEIAKGPY